METQGHFSCQFMPETIILKIPKSVYEHQKPKSRLPRLKPEITTKVETAFISYNMIICREMGLAIQAFQHVNLLSPGGDTCHTLLLQGVYSVIHLEIHSETHPHGTVIFAIMYHVPHMP